MKIIMLLLHAFFLWYDLFTLHRNNLLFMQTCFRIDKHKSIFRGPIILLEFMYLQKYMYYLYFWYLVLYNSSQHVCNYYSEYSDSRIKNL